MINNVTIAGRLAKDPELKYTPQGKPVTNVTIAVQRSFKNAQGEYDADFVQCVIWGNIAETVANRTGKGKMFGVTGRIQTRNFEGQDGKRVYVTEVVAEKTHIIEWNDNGQGGQSRQSGQGGQGSGGNYTKVEDDPFSTNGNTIDISDDDLPF